MGENRTYAVNGFGDGMTSELKMEGLGGSKQEGTRVLTGFERRDPHLGRLVMRIERICKADANMA